MTFVAGGYASNYGGVSLGVTQRGFEVEWTTFEDPIIGDNMADSPQDAVYTGVACHINTVVQEYDFGKASLAFWPWASSALFGTLGLVGRMKWDLSASLLLTAVVGTRARTVGPLTITFPATILAGNFPVRMLLAARHRSMPIRMQAFPYYTNATTTPVGTYNDGNAQNSYCFQVS